MGGILRISFLHALIVTIIHMAQSNPEEIRQYCNMENFIAECADDEVVMMKTAHYGRMRMNRCVTVDYGNLGCSLDVLRHFDSLCSGRQRCQIKIPDDELYSMRPCPADMVSYVEASYTCVKVLPSRNLHQECQQRKVIELHQPAGIISSALAGDEAGRHLCPIVVRASPGQRVNITLFDFGSAISHHQGRGGLGGASVVCQRYALIKEVRTASPTIVCSGNQRTRGVYLSDGSTVEIQLVHTRHHKDSAHFLLQYSVIGCPNPALHGHHLVDRNAQRAIVRCNQTGHQATLVCTGSSWIGEIGNCSAKPGKWSVWGVLADDWSSPHGILITVGLGVALGVVIGVTLLVCVLLCLRRRRRADADGRANSGEADDNLYGQPDYSLPPGDHQEKWPTDFTTATMPGYPRSSLARDGHYTHGWSTDPRAGGGRDPRTQITTDGSLGVDRDGGSGGDNPHHRRLNSFGHPMYDRTEHIYEKPS